VKVISSQFRTSGDTIVRCDTVSLFSNGQMVSLSTSGWASRVRPRIEDIVSNRSPVNMFLNGDGSLHEIALFDGVGLGIEWTVTLRRPDQFSGSAWYTQLIRRTQSYNTYPLGMPGIPNQTDGSFWLDTSDPYRGVVGFPISGATARPVYLGDNPGLIEGLFGFYDRAENQDDFRTYLRWQPDTPGSIPVTVGRIDRGWHGKAEKISGVWTLTVRTAYGPNLDGAEENFPDWTRVYHNN
jgi:hypothetical protein